MTTTETSNQLSDAAAILLAEAKGDSASSALVLEALLDRRDLAGALLTLRAVVSVAGMALQADLTARAEAGEDTAPAVSLLAALARHTRAG